jgi:hypothetical protein
VYCILRDAYIDDEHEGAQESTLLLPAQGEEVERREHHGEIPPGQDHQVVQQSVQ